MRNADAALYDARRGYRIAVSSFFFVCGLCFSSWTSRIPTIQHKLNLNDAELGAILLSSPIGLMMSLPLAGWLVAKFGSRIIVVIVAVFYPPTDHVASYCRPCKSCKTPDAVKRRHDGPTIDPLNADSLSIHRDI